jgi:undecaprenyl-diphosphatase
MALGLIFFLVGLTHHSTVLAKWDQQIFIRLNKFLSHNSLIPFFKTLWPLGTTPVSMMVFLLVFVIHKQSGLFFILTYVIAAIFEFMIKKGTFRQRPFNIIPKIAMQQPRQPHDSSFPSGDSLRIWFLVIGISGILNWYLPFAAVAVALAMLISLGRIAMGVHFPLDVLGGAGLGLFFAGVFLAMQ